MRKFLFSIICALVSFVVALAPSAQAQTKSDAEALKKAKEAEESAKKEAAKRAKEAEKAAKKAREQEEIARKAERVEAEQKARARDEALRRARAAAAAANKTGSKTAAKSAEEAAGKASVARNDGVKTSNLADNRNKAVEDARKAAELAREASQKAEAKEAARKAKEAEEAARHEASVRKAQEKEAAEQLRNLTKQQESERKAKEAELARKAKAEKEAARKAQAEEAVRQARAEAEARNARVAEEVANREMAKEAARREKEAQELAAKTKAQEEAARNLQYARAQSVSTEQPRAAVSNVAYEGETFRIVKVTKDGTASVVAPTAVQPVVVANSDSDAKAEAARQAEMARAARIAREEESRMKAEAARRNRESEAASRQAATRDSAQSKKQQAIARVPATSQPSEPRRVVPVGRVASASMVPPPQPEPIPAPANLSAQEQYTSQERIAAAQLRARREALEPTIASYVPATDLSGSSSRQSRSSRSQARYYEELWEKELAARAAKQPKQVQPVIANSDDRRAQARYYEELWRKEQESKAARVATERARTSSTESAAFAAQQSAEQKRLQQLEIARKAAQAESAQRQREQNEAARKAREIELASVKAAKEQQSKVVATAPQSAAAAKDAELKAERDRLTASIEASRKAPEADTFSKVQLDARAAEQRAVKRAEEDARKARAQEDAARKALEQAAAKKAKEEREAMARAEQEAAKKARAEDAARRAAEQEAAKRNREQRSNTPVAQQIQVDSTAKEGFFSRFRSSEKSKVPAPDVSALLTDEERLAQDRALEALRQKQMELDAQEAQLRSGSAPVISTPVYQAPAPAVRPTPVAPVISAEEAAKEARALAASQAELTSLRGKLSNVSAERQKVAAEIEKAQKEISSPSSAGTGKKFEVIVDNSDARLVGTWAEGKTGGFYGKDYAFKGKGTGSNYAEFIPNLPTAGEYEVFEWHVAGANRAADAPYIVNYNGGSQVITVNQQNNGGKWNSIGRFSFAAGQNGGVRITDGIGLQGQMVMADAIRFVLVGGDGDATQVVDNSARERAVEALRIKQDALSAEETRLKNQVQAAQKRIATLEKNAEERAAGVLSQAAPAPAPVVTAPSSEAEIQARALEALRQREAELNAAAEKPKSKKLLSVKSAPEPVTIQEPARPLTAKEQKLADLLRRYKADEITPREYHQERAKILAE